TLLEEASMPVASIVAVTTYVVAAPDLEDRLAAVMDERDRFMDSHLAASTLITVPRLVREEWFVEIVVIAAR
ncbi:MAG: RidA family protein, partial [Actinomycetota bacterium]|nr:RidA family protein [Actinomycetota bacterium]